MIFVCSSGEDNDAPVSVDFDPRNDVPRSLNSLDRGGNVSLSECDRSAAHWGLQGQLSEVVRKGLVGIGHPMRILPPLYRGPAIVGGVEELAREPLLHCIFRASART